MDLREDGRKKKGEKMRRENFLESVWFGGGERKMMVGFRCFLSEPIKNFLTKMGRKLNEVSLIGLSSTLLFSSSSSFFLFLVVCSLYVASSKWRKLCQSLVCTLLPLVYKLPLVNDKNLFFFFKVIFFLDVIFFYYKFGWFFLSIFFFQ